MKKILISQLILIMMFLGCKNKDSSSLLPNVTGKSGEVVLVIDPDLWSSEVGVEFRKKLIQPYPALPQNEPYFDLVHIPYVSFTSIFKTHRNIILTKINEKLDEPRIVVQKDLWAKPQLLINVVAPSDSAMATLINEKGDLLVDRIMKKEIGRYTKNYVKYRDPEITGRIKNKFGINLTIPKGYSIGMDTTDFMWLDNKGYGDAVQGILIYSYDKPDVQLTTSYLFAKRNQFTKSFVPGAVEKSYMAVEMEMSPYRREIEVNDFNVIELRSLWKVENDFMGGPFISFSFVDNEKNKVINIDGFVYAPQFDKRDYIRQLEAILNTLKKPVNE